MTQVKLIAVVVVLLAGLAGLVSADPGMTRYTFCPVDGTTGQFIEHVTITVTSSAGTETTTTDRHTRAEFLIPNEDTSVSVDMDAAGYLRYAAAVALPTRHGAGLCPQLPMYPGQEAVK